MNPFALCQYLEDEGMDHTCTYMLRVAELMLHKASDCTFMKLSKTKREDTSEREKLCF